MKFGSGTGGSEASDLDGIDLGILDLLQENCKRPLAAIGEKVGLSAPAVLERIHKLEEAGVIRGYTALLDGRRLGKDVTAFIGVSLSHPREIERFEREIARADEVLESHHVTGEHTLLLKAKTENTASLERLLERVRSIEGVTRTETNIVLSTHRETPRLPLHIEEGRRTRKAGRRAGRRSEAQTGEGR